MHKYSGEEFLSKLYRDMHTEDQVEKYSKPSDSKYEKIRKYLNRLKEVHEKLTKKEKLDLIKHFYYKKYIIKPENVTEEYFKHLEEMALNRGYGHVIYNEEAKRLEKERITNDQKKSLDIWIDYLCSEDTNMYPMWFKYYIFQSMVKLGTYNKEKNIFNQRTKNTISIFPDLNREAISLMYDYFNAQMNGEQEFDDNELEKLINGGSFKKIYAYLIKKISLTKKELSSSNNGEWIKYEQGTDHMPLVKSLEGKGTGWCTAGESTAKSQLRDGDFYVYYSYDNEGKPTIPRIAIRMEDNSIAEIRGIAENQSLELEMECIVEKKLEEFPDKEDYKKKVQDTALLTKIYKKIKNNEKITLDELRFLYELDSEIRGFGYVRDPRIEEIIKSRNQRKDLSQIFNCKEEQIALTEEEALSGNIVFYKGNLYLSHLTSSENLTFPKILNGGLYLDGLTSAKNLIMPETLNGKLCLRELTNAKGLTLPKILNGELALNSLKNAEGLKLPEIINGNINLGKLSSAESLELPNTINGNLILNNLTSAIGLRLPDNINGTIFLESLTSAVGLKFPKKLNGSLILSNLTSAEGLTLPEIIKGNLDLNGLTSAVGLRLLDNINGTIFLNGLTSAIGLKLPEKLNGGLYLDGLTRAEGLTLPEIIKGNLDLNGITSAKGLKLPKKLNGSLDLSGLTSTEGLKLQEKLNGSLYLKGLTSAEGLTLPETINGNLDLSGLTSTVGLILPKTINGSLDLRGLTSAEGLTLPETIKGKLYLNENLKSSIVIKK